MKIKTGIICVGCGKDSADLAEYDEDNPVIEDGTFQNDKFVCTECYIKLIPMGLDVGPPAVIQMRIIQFRARKLHDQQQKNEKTK